MFVCFFIYLFTFTPASQETFQNNNLNGTPFSPVQNNAADIKEYSHNLNNKNASSHRNFAVNNSELENYSNNANLHPKSLTHLKSNSNEIKMDIYEDERYFCNSISIKFLSILFY